MVFWTTFPSLINVQLDFLSPFWLLYFKKLLVNKRYLQIQVGVFAVLNHAKLDYVSLSN